MTMPGGGHDMMRADWTASLLDFWFDQVGEAGWWGHDPDLDRLCDARFRALWDEKRLMPPAAFLDRADEALAAVLLFDQMPRNMFRGTARAFSTDRLAVDIARGAVAHGYDLRIGGAGRLFFYMPFQHSEAMEDQTLSLRLFERAGDANALHHARQHHAIIARFGRFPHRNAALGRTTLPEEEAAAAQGTRW